jgi:hypothetical protein
MQRIIRCSSRRATNNATHYSLQAWLRPWRGLLLLGCGEAAIRFCPPLDAAVIVTETISKRYGRIEALKGVHPSSFILHPSSFILSFGVVHVVAALHFSAHQ